MEIWKPVPIAHLSKIFEVSNLGNVRYAPRTVRHRNTQGYRQVTLKYKGEQKTIKVHRLVAGAFLGPPSPDDVVNHKNSDRSDNRPENLEWTTVQGNTDHHIAAGRKPRGLQHASTKIDPDRALQMRNDGFSFREIGEVFSATPQAVSQMLKRIK